MSEKPPLFDRIRQARMFQVLAVYLGASWAVLQIADVLQSTAGLPDWVGAFTLLLLLVGLVIILATAWVQSLPSTTAREEAGEVPSDWQVAPAEALDSLKAGKLPHLTWGRAIVGGVVALSVLFGGAGAYVLLTGSPGFMGPSEVGAGEASAGIAVLPFDVAGEGLEVWREGMVDVLSNNLDGLGGNRTIDSRTVLARWRERVPGEARPDLETSLQVAGATGARYGLLGGMVGTPSGVRINAELYDLSDGLEVLQVSREGPTDSVLALVSEVSVELTRELLAKTGGDLIAAPRTASLTTTSLPALRAYLEGEAAFRESDFAAAVAAYELAVDTDSTFALAWFRLSSSYGWLDDAGNPLGLEAGRRAVDMADRLPVRDQLLLRASRALSEGDFTYVEQLEGAALNYPDDPEVWFTLGELYLHGGANFGWGTWEDINRAFSTAVALDPSFTPYQVHWIEGAIIAGDTATAVQAIEAYRQGSSNQVRLAEFELLSDLFLSEPGGREAVLAGLDRVDPQTLQAASQWGKVGLPDQAWVEQVARRAYEVSGHPWWYFTAADAMLIRGRFDDLEVWLADPTGPIDTRTDYGMLISILGGDTPETALAAASRGGSCPIADEPFCSLFMSWAATQTPEATQVSEPQELRRAADSLASVPGEELRARRLSDAATTLEGLRALHETGDSTTAARQLWAVRNSFPGVIGFYVRWNAVDALERQRPRDALELLDNMDGAPKGYASIRAGRIYETLGNRDEALAAYRRAADQDADPGEPWSVEARGALARLGN